MKAPLPGQIPQSMQGIPMRAPMMGQQQYQPTPQQQLDQMQAMQQAQRQQAMDDMAQEIFVRIATNYLGKDGVNESDREHLRQIARDCAVAAKCYFEGNEDNA